MTGLDGWMNEWIEFTTWVCTFFYQSFAHFLGENGDQKIFFHDFLVNYAKLNKFRVVTTNICP